MKLIPPFTYYKPETIEEAISLLDEFKEAKVIAGGTDLIPLIRDGKYTPQKMVDISFIDELNFVREEGGYIKIGAATTHSDILNSKILNEKTNVLVQAVKNLGSPQIRNLGTIGGNLCNASPAADTAPPLLVLEAELLIQGSKGERRIPVKDFFLGPGKTILKRNEILREIHIPSEVGKMKGVFLKLGRREAHTLSIVCTAVLLKADTEFEDIRIALGAVAPIPIRAKETESYLRGKEVTEKKIDEGTEIVKKEVKPITDVRGTKEYRTEMSKVFVKRAINKALKGEVECK